MKIVISHCNKYDFLNELYIPIKKDYKLSSHNIYLPEENRAVSTKEIIKNCDIVIAEVSYPATGQGIELGWADYADKPIYCIHKTGSKYASSLKFITSEFYSYSSEKELVDVINKIIELHDGKMKY